MRGDAIERLSADDLVSFAEDCGAVPLHVSLIALLAPGPPLTPEQALRALEERLPGVPRLRRRLVRPPGWLGRPLWCDDPGFDVGRHVTVLERAGGLAEVLAVADDLITRPLDWRHPLWAARVVTGLDGGAAAVVFASHHVLADGLAGVELLRGLAAAHPAPADPAFPRAAPTRRALLADQVRGWGRVLRALPGVVRHVRAATALLRATRQPLIAPSSLNRPVGTRRRSVVVTADAGALRAAAHAAGASLRDLLLTALGEALGGLLAARGEPRDAIVFSMLVSTRTPAAAAVGNGSGLVQVAVPTAGPPGERLAAVAGRTAVAKRQDRAAANTLLGAAVRVLGGLHLFHAFSVRQRLVHTFETTLRVPGEPLVLLGRPVVGLIAQPVVNGNLTVVSASVEYLGRLTVTLMADPDACPDLDALRDRLAAVLEAPSGRYGAKTEA